MSDLAIRVERLGKQYRIGTGQPGYRTFREALIDGMTVPINRIRGLTPTAEDRTIWALREVSFEVKQGEVLGIIGKNGAGKTTLLKILSRITEPTEGCAELYGRVGSLLEVGTGFHPELSGRENIYLNGAILGMKRDEIRHRFDEIVAFAEVEQFIDTPVKHYSSGMHMRLAFAVAAHLEPEILLVDEVLAVGDAAFQKKCLGKMGDVAGEGRTVLFVSHNMYAVTALCQRAILVDQGKISADMKSRDVVDLYESWMREKVDANQADIRFPVDSSKRGQITHVRILKKDGDRSLSHSLLDPIRIEMEFVLREDFQTMLLEVHLWGSGNTLVLGTMDSDWENFIGESKRDRFPRKAGCYQASLIIPSPLLNRGTYELEFVLTPGPARIDTQRGIYLEIVDQMSFLSYVTKSSRGGFLAVPIPWEVRRENGEGNPSHSARAESGEYPREKRK